MDEGRDDREMVQGSLFGPGARLRGARQGAGLSLQQVSAETRISLRHLEMIEREDFIQLPGRTYAVGFSRNYAKLVGLDDVEIAADVRAALDAANPDRYRPVASAFEPGDPARVPSSRLSWLLAGSALLLLVGATSFYRSFFAPGGELPSLVEPSAPAKPRPGPVQAAVSPRGAVVFTALEEGVWVKFYDGQGRQLMQKLMARGESYTVPAGAEGPQLWTGRPDALAITIGGRSVPRLAEQEGVVKDVLVTAQALLARGTEAPAAAAPPESSGSERRRPARTRSPVALPSDPEMTAPPPEFPPPVPPAPEIPDPASASPTG